MSKRIIFCADGTWDSMKNDTNVFKLYHALEKTVDQVTFYDDGVGVDGNWFERLVGGAFGEGLFDKVKDGYAKIASVYEPGDEIFLFGFSRGAYTARSIAGMISQCGIPVGNTDPGLIDLIFNAYRKEENRFDEQGLLAGHTLTPAPIKMVGVWDTVGSLGIPALFGRVDPIKYGFLDTSLHPNIQNAYQALALDEHRREFPPTLWQEPSPPVPGQTVQQVWFSGAHCDAGGGYPQAGLSDIALAWMMDKGEKLGMKVAPAISVEYKALRTDPALGKQSLLDRLHHSWDLFWGLPKFRTVPAGSLISNTIGLRCAADSFYRPRDLLLENGMPSSSYKVVDTVAVTASVVAPAAAAAPAQKAPAPGKGPVLKLA